MANTDLISWLQLAHCKNVGPVTFWQALARFGSCKEALTWLQNNNKSPVIPPEQWVKQLIESCKKAEVKLLTGHDELYPDQLRELRDAPPVLFVKGHLESLKSAMIGIVGARNCSFSAKRQAHALAESLGKAGFYVVSGLARGIDQSAHQGSLESGTIAVVAGGVDVIYPHEHQKLYERIQLKGCIVSEMPLGTKPSPHFFPRRNRIISGLSRGIIVVEAAMRSGSLITARYALDQSREVFAVPGSPQDPRCHGSNHLLKQGAHFVQSVEDVLEVLQPEFNLNTLSESSVYPYIATTQEFSVAASVKEAILSGLSHIPVAVEFIAEDLCLSMQEILAVILELELEGLIVRQSNGSVAISNC